MLLLPRDGHKTRGFNVVKIAFLRLKHYAKAVAVRIRSFGGICCGTQEELGQVGCILKLRK